MKYSTNKIRQNFKGTQKDLILFLSSRRGDPEEEESLLNDEKERESLDLGLKLQSLPIAPTSINPIYFLPKQAKLTLPKLDFSRVGERSTVCIFLDSFEKSGCFLPQVPIFDLWILFLPWLTKDSISLLGFLQPST